jgi:hypothetical protein
MAEEKNMAEDKKATAKPEPTVDDTTPPPAGLAEEQRQAWAKANNRDPAEMTEIHYPGGWVDRFDGAGWVRENGS